MPHLGPGLQDYWERSRSHTYSLLMALPLLLGYELLIGLVNRFRPGDMQVRNLAEMLMMRLSMRAGMSGHLAFVGLLILASLLIIALEWRRDPALGWRGLDARTFGLMFLESLGWAYVFYLLVSRATAFLLSPFAEAAGPKLLALSAAELRPLEGLALSLGAGLYEELLFRVILISGIIWLLTVTGLTSRGPATLVAVLTSALLFSLAHYTGGFGDPFTASSFIFRFIGGLLFSVIYALRGFGIVTWTHALYDLGFYLLL